MNPTQYFSPDTVLSNLENQTPVFQIKNRFNSLSKTNQRIATYILNHVSSMSEMSISQLSKKVQASPSSITRFCQIFGFSGFPELKYYISNNQSPFYIEDKYICPNEPLESVKQKITSLYQQMVKESVSLVDETLLQRAVKRISTANRIIFFSQGGSGIAAQLAQISFMQIGLSCHCYNDMSISKLAAAEMTPDDVAVGISFSGMAKVPVDALQIAQAKKVCTICITGFSNSHLMRYADIPFCYNCKVNDDISSMNVARICEIAIIGLLQGCILSFNYDHAHKSALELKKATLLGRYGTYHDPAN